MKEVCGLGLRVASGIRVQGLGVWFVRRECRDEHTDQAPGHATHPQHRDCFFADIGVKNPQASFLSSSLGFRV